MKIHELIEILQQYNQELDVQINYETYGYANIEKVDCNKIIYNGRKIPIVFIVAKNL